MRDTIGLDLAKTAALFVDLQEEHRGDQRFLAVGYDRVIANAVRLQAAARGAGIPLIHCAYVVDTAAPGNRPFHPTLADGTSVFSDSADPLTALCPEVAPRDGETLVIKRRASAFSEAAVEAELRAKGVEWLLIAGVWTEACVDATVKDAIDRGFRVLLVKDACASGSEAMHQVAVLNLANRLYGGAITTTEGACHLLAGEPVDVWRLDGAVPFRFGYRDAPSIYGSL